MQTEGDRERYNLILMEVHSTRTIVYSKCESFIVSSCMGTASWKRMVAWLHVIFGRRTSFDC